MVLSPEPLCEAEAVLLLSSTPNMYIFKKPKDRPERAWVGMGRFGGNQSEAHAISFLSKIAGLS